MRLLPGSKKQPSAQGRVAPPAADVPTLVRAGSATNFEFSLGDLSVNVTRLASPSLGATEIVLYRATFSPGADVALHMHDHEEVATIVAGSGNYLLDGERIEVGPGDTVIVPARTLHRLQGGDDGLDAILATPAGTLFFAENGAEAPEQPGFMR
jgi:quercetin dioxygenase-like cupin family protein